MNRSKAVTLLMIAVFLLSGVSLVRELVAPTVALADGRVCFDECNSYWCGSVSPQCGYSWNECVASCINWCCGADNQCFSEAFNYGEYYCSSCYPNC